MTRQRPSLILPSVLLACALAAPHAAAQRKPPPSPPPAPTPTLVPISSLSLASTTGTNAPSMPAAPGGQSWMRAKAIVQGSRVEDGPMCIARIDGVLRVGRLEVDRPNPSASWGFTCYTAGGSVRNSGDVLVNTTNYLSWISSSPQNVNRGARLGINQNGTVAKACRGKATYRSVTVSTMAVNSYTVLLEGTLWGSQCEVNGAAGRELVPVDTVLIWQTGSAG